MDLTNNINDLYKNLQITDELISKILKLSEMSKIARAEKRLRDYYYLQWQILVKKSIKNALRALNKGKKSKEIIKIINKIIDKWPILVKKNIKLELRRIYKFARIAGWKKANRQTRASLQYNIDTKVKKSKKILDDLLPTFDMADKESMRILDNYQMFWVNKFYDKNIRQKITKTVQDTIFEHGEDLGLAGRLLEESLEGDFSKISILGGFNGTTQQYFNGLVANAATIARNFAQIRSFEQIGITKYEIINPSDERTCPVCSHMDGKIFSIEHATTQIQEELSASSPEDIKNIHPWLSYKDLLKISPQKGQLNIKNSIKDSRALADAGFSLPPYHLKCRCTVDVSEDIGSYEFLNI